MRWPAPLRLLALFLVGLSCGQAAEYLVNRKSLETLQQLKEAGTFVSEEKMFEAWIDESRRKHGLEHPNREFTLLYSALALNDIGNYSSALRLFTLLVELSTELRGLDDQKTAYYLGWEAGMHAELGEFSQAILIERKVLATIKRTRGLDHLDTLTAKTNLAGSLGALGKMTEARFLQEEVLDTSRRTLGDEHPHTLTARANLALTLRDLGDFTEARQNEKDVFDIRQRILGVEHPDTLTSRASLAATRRAMGDITGARKEYEEIYEQFIQLFGEEHPDTLTARVDLAGLLFDLGDLATARRHEEEVLTIQIQSIGEEHPDTLMTKANLAGTLRGMEDLSTARNLYEEVLCIQIQLLGNRHLSTLITKANLAEVFFDLRRLDSAQKLEEEVHSARIDILGKDHPDTLKAKENLAGTYFALRYIWEAQYLYEEALEVRERNLGKQHPDTWVTMHNLAMTMRQVGNFERARKLLQDIIRLRSSTLGSDHQSDTLEEANNFFLLGIIEQDLCYLDEASASFATGLQALERQTQRISISEDIKGRYRARHGEAYHNALNLEFTRKKPEDAFHLLERYRTQSLVTLLSRNRPDSRQKAPERLRHALGNVARQYDRLISHRDSEAPKNDTRQVHERNRLRRHRDIAKDQIAQLSDEVPLAPLTFDKARLTLDPGTLVVAYSVGKENIHLFTFTDQEPMEVHDVDIEAPLLRQQIEQLGRIGFGAVSGSQAGRQAMLSWLYDKLLRPATKRIEQAERILILPDGSLHDLPFAALTRPLKEDPRGWQYLAEWKPIHTVQSATVYAELLAKRPGLNINEGKQPWQWVGFGDPVYPVDGLPELPFTEREVEGIAAQFPDDKSHVLLRRDATEYQARAILSQARIAHFAMHGRVDPNYPMDSFLAFSLLVEEDGLSQNGLLQAWEIVDYLKLDADLVVLSACVTAFGPERGGEGLISLSRAFQIAGARSVLASLWSVNDESTSELMIRFYRHLLAGETKDQALRSAQMELIRGPVMVEGEDGKSVERDFTAPYHWAAFQLIGDWK